MREKPSLAVVLKNFHGSMDTALSIYGSMREYLRWREAFEASVHPLVAAKVIGLAFLSMVAAWDEFVEETFVRYLCGSCAPSRYAPRLRIGPCESRKHALQVVTNSQNVEGRNYLRWHDFVWVTSIAPIYFQDGKPFTSVSTHFQARLKDAQHIRNRVAHSSLHARRQFKRVANQLLGMPADSPLRRGFSPGLLMAEPAEPTFSRSWLAQFDLTWEDYFEAYTAMFLDLGDTLVPSPGAPHGIL